MVHQNESIMEVEQIQHGERGMMDIELEEYKAAVSNNSTSSNPPTVTSQATPIPSTSITPHIAPVHVFDGNVSNFQPWKLAFENYLKMQDIYGYTLGSRFHETYCKTGYNTTNHNTSVNMINMMRETVTVANHDVALRDIRNLIMNLADIVLQSAHESVHRTAVFNHFIYKNKMKALGVALGMYIDTNTYQTLYQGYIADLLLHPPNFTVQQPVAAGSSEIPAKENYIMFYESIVENYNFFEIPDPVVLSPPAIEVVQDPATAPDVEVPLQTTVVEVSSNPLPAVEVSDPPAAPGVEQK